MGIINPWNLKLIIEQAKVPVLVDAGVGTASDAAIAMELGCDGVLMNTAIAGAQDPVLMAGAMKKAVEAGREAFRAGRMPRKLYAATPSSPTGGLIGTGRQVKRLLAGILLATLLASARAEDAPQAVTPAETLPALEVLPKRQGYAFEEPGILIRQRLFGLAHGLSMLAAACLDLPEATRSRSRIPTPAGMQGRPRPLKPWCSISPAITSARAPPRRNGRT
jgi:hypothetical protein